MESRPLQEQLKDKILGSISYKIQSVNDASVDIKVMLDRA